MRPGPKSKVENVEIEGTRVSRALDAVLSGKIKMAELFDAIERVSGLPGPRPNLLVLRSIGADIASRKQPELLSLLLEQKRAALFRAAVYTVSAKAREKGGQKKAITQIHDLSEEPEKERRDALIDALAETLAVAPDVGVGELAAFTDGFLHAFVALEAATDSRVLSNLTQGDELIARLGEAFQLAHDAPRSADRAQGVRQLRQGFPAQIARIAPRFEQVLDFVDQKSQLLRPETREIMAQTITALRKVVGEAHADRLRERFEGSAPIPRDAARIVAGTRKRSRGRK